MKSILDIGRSLLRSQASSLSSERICYRRDGMTVADDVHVRVGQTHFVTDSFGQTAMHQFRIDIIVDSDKIGQITPRPGDLIGLRGRCFIVAAPDNEPCWRWHDRELRTMRIHLEEIADEQID